MIIPIALSPAARMRLAAIGRSGAPFGVKASLVPAARARRPASPGTLPADAPAYGLWLLVVMNLLVFIIIMLGFLLQWPTIPTLAMFPFLVFLYVHLAHAEEAEARQAFGDAYARYAARVPGSFPSLRPSEAGHGLT